MLITWASVKVIRDDHPRAGQAGVIVKPEYTLAAAAHAEAERLLAVAAQLDESANALRRERDKVVVAYTVANDAAMAASMAASTAQDAEKSIDPAPWVDVRFDATIETADDVVANWAAAKRKPV